MRLGGFGTLPFKLGGGKPRTQVILDSLNAARGTAYDPKRTVNGYVGGPVYVENLAYARAINAAWSTTIRGGYCWDPLRCPEEILERWETILARPPAYNDSLTTRRQRIASVFAQFGQASVTARLTSLLSAALGSVFVAVEHVAYASAVILVPDGSYPWGVVGDSPWSNSLADVKVKLQKPVGYTEADFYAAAAKVALVTEPMLPAWVTISWYRPGPIFSSVGGITGAGFYLDDDHNLDNETFD